MGIRAHWQGLAGIGGYRGLKLVVIFSLLVRSVL